MSSRQTLILSAACMAVAGCNTVHSEIGQEDPFLGESVRYNAAVQTINPDPVYPEGAAEPGSSGAKGAAAVARYRTDQVNARHRTETAASQSGGLSTTQGTSGGPR
jgi:hypothetical protein